MIQLIVVRGTSSPVTRQGARELPLDQHLPRSLTHFGAALTTPTGTDERTEGRNADPPEHELSQPAKITPPQRQARNASSDALHENRSSVRLSECLHQQLLVSLTHDHEPRAPYDSTHTITSRRLYAPYAPHARQLELLGTSLRSS